MTESVDISDLQRKMNELGSSLKVDGSAGPVTRRELMRYLREYEAQRADTIPVPSADVEIIHDSVAPTARTGSGELAAVNPSKFRLSAGSVARLTGVHPDLVKVVRYLEAHTTMPFAVVDGLRTKEQQEVLVARGASRTLNSRHLTGHAVDMVPLTDDGRPSWSWTLIWTFLPEVKSAARMVGVTIEAGAEWVSFPDGCHYQLPRSHYP